ncbi:MAG: hypothetical protein LBQ36_02745 [Synergistaceae bacterium]|nr:hypothetical protein [Synergistaceae bacterium]
MRQTSEGETPAIKKMFCYRFNREHRPMSYYSLYEIPSNDGMTVLDMLDYAARHLDPSLSYPMHSRCDQGLCARCALRVNGKPVLSCIEICGEEILIVEPLDKKRVCKDLVSYP